jgi:hypothetical protein
MTENSPEIESIILEAKTGYDMRARLNGSARRKASIKIFTNEVAADELGYAKDVDKVNTFGIVDGTTRERVGILGLIDGDDGSDDAYSAQLDTEAAALRKLLDESALTFSLAAVPTLVVQGARRKARESFGIKGTTIPDADVENYNHAYVARLFSAIIVSFVDHETGETYDGLDYDGAASLKDLLPPSEYARFDAKVVELQFKNAIDESVTAQADF